MLNRLLTNGRAAATAISVFADDITTIINLVMGIPPTAGNTAPSEFGWTGFQERHFINRVKRLAQDEFRRIGVPATVVDGIASAYLPPDSRWLIDDRWEEAREAGAEELILVELNNIEGFAGICSVVNGRVIDWLKQAWAWAVEHQDQLLRIAKILLSFLILLGIL